MQKSVLASAAVSTQEKVKSASLEFLIFNALTGTDLPIPTDLSIQEIERATKHFNASIFKDWTILNATLKRYEATIQKRWMYVSCLQNSVSPLAWRFASIEVTSQQRRFELILTEAHRKKNVKARRDILLRAWPSMSATHRPDFVNLRAVKKQAPRSRTCMAEAYLWPYINLEDLQQRNFLLVFLNSRGRNLPDTFRLADVKAAHLGDGWEKVSQQTDMIRPTFALLRTFAYYYFRRDSTMVTPSRSTAVRIIMSRTVTNRTCVCSSSRSIRHPSMVALSRTTPSHCPPSSISTFS